jgi:plastocyanin
MRTRLPLVALLLVASACGSSDDKGTTAAPTTATSSGPEILIKNFAYNAVTVAPGTTITVKNLDDAAHTVTSKEKGVFDVKAIESGTPKTFTAPAKAGTYEYVCTYHASMKGTLTVS